MNFSIYFSLISCLSIIIGETIPLPDETYLEGIAGGNQSNLTGSEDLVKLILSKKGEISRKNYSDWNNVLVWKGTFNQTIDVAIKIVSDEQKMQKEMNIFEALKATENFDIKKHRIPRVYYHGPFLGKYYAIAMTLFEGTLEERCMQLKSENKTFSESTFLLIFKQAVESLSYIHSKNVTHNDIHLRNIFIRGNDVFIGDFDASFSGPYFVDDYENMVFYMWQLFDMLKYISNDEKVKNFQNENVREAFRSILNTKNIKGKFGTVPDYEKIIKISDDALAKIGKKSTGRLKYEYVKQGKHSSSSSSGGCFFFPTKHRK